jgi:hypothetical protein
MTAKQGYDDENNNKILFWKVEISCLMMAVFWVVAP